jgi:Zn-dependent protease with chaperone function
VAIEMVRGYEQISSKAYEHPADKAATSALHSVPLLDTVIKRLTDLGHERRLRQIVMGNAIRLGPGQVPEVFQTYVRCSRIIDVETTPDLYVVSDPEINAMTIGAKTPLVVVNSSLLRSFDNKEVETVLGHELSHVLSEHYYYTTALLLLSQFLKGALPRSLLLGLPARAMYLALLEWHRAAELSADRAAALIMADPLQPCRVLMSLAGGSVPGMDFDVFLQQCADYDSEDDLFSRHTRFWSELNLTHPVAVKRVKELMEWCRPAPTTASETATTRGEAKSRPRPRSSKTPWRTTGSASRASSSGRPAASKSWGAGWAAGSSGCRPRRRETTTSMRTRSSETPIDPAARPPCIPDSVTTRPYRGSPQGWETSDGCPGRKQPGPATAGARKRR